MESSKLNQDLKRFGKIPSTPLHFLLILLGQQLVEGTSTLHHHALNFRSLNRPLRSLSVMASFAPAAIVVLVVVVAVCPSSALAEARKAPWRMHTLFSVECQDYFDWQTVGLMHSYRKARQPGPITRLLSCTDEQRRRYRGMGLAPTFEVPSMSRHPRTGDW